MIGGLGLAVVAIVGLLIGVWLGMPGRDRQSAEDIERAMESGTGTGRRRRAKRSLNPLAWIQRKVDTRPTRGRGSGRRGFKIESPDDRD